MALTKISNNSLSAISSLPASIPTGALTLISTQTASSSASIEFTSGIDSTYDSYVFKFIDIHPSTYDTDFQFNMSTDTGSTYAVTKTTTFFEAYNDETGTSNVLHYWGTSDLAQSTSYQSLNRRMGNDTDKTVNGTLTIYNPSSSTFVKHFISSASGDIIDDYNLQSYTAGYGNTTSPVDAIKFQMNSGTFSGTIKLYGVS